MDTSMKCAIINITICFLISVAMVELAVSITEIGTEPGSVGTSVGDYGKESHFEVFSSTTTGAPNKATISPSSSGGGGSPKTPSQPAITVTSERDPIKIVKIITPNIKDGERPLGETAQVRVEIYSNQNEKIKLNIREFVDNSIPVFRSAANAYILTGSDEISYYKLGLLECLESGSLDKMVNSTHITICNYRCSIETKSIKKYSIYERNHEYMRMRMPLLGWPIQKNCSLANYSDLRTYLKRLLNLNDTAINNMTINCTRDGNLSIQYNGNLEIKIRNNSSDCLDRGNAILTYNGVVHHLIFVQNKTDNKNYIYDTSNIISLDNIELEPDAIIVFWYNIMPYESGIYDTETLVTIEDLKKIVSGHLEIEIAENNPLFKVSRTFTSIRIFKWDELDIQYNIDYLGGGPKTQMRNIPVRLDNSTYFEDVNNNEPSLSEEDFCKNKSIIINKKIKFNRDGEFTLPGIWVNSRHYDFGENQRTVTVDIPFWRYLNGISLLLALITFIIGILIKDIYLNDNPKAAKLMTDTIVKLEKVINSRNKQYLLIFILLMIMIKLGLWLFRPWDLPGFL